MGWVKVINLCKKKNVSRTGKVTKGNLEMSLPSPQIEREVG